MTTKSRTLSWIALGLSVLFSPPLSRGYTDPRDVYAISNLYASLGSPPLPGWSPVGGDPCYEGWQGVQCVISNITAIVLNNANLGGQLGDKLNYFASIITLDLSNNNIGGSIPESLPVTMRELNISNPAEHMHISFLHNLSLTAIFDGHCGICSLGSFLSANQLTGRIPNSLSGLSLLSDMSLNGNHLTEEIPDAFESLSSLVNLDLSSNDFSGPLPPSMGNLSSLTTLYVQNNQLTGLLDILQDLPLKYLNIENNLFSGPVPEKLFNIPNFKKDGNPFNTTIAPSPMLLPPPLPLSGAPAPRGGTFVGTVNQPSAQETSSSALKIHFSTAKIVGCVVAAVVLVVAVLSILLWMSKCQEKQLNNGEVLMGQDCKEHGFLQEPKEFQDMMELNKGGEKIQREAFEKQKKSEIGMTGTGVVMMSRASLDKDSVRPVAPSINNGTSSAENVNPLTSLTSFSVASLEQYTNSFDEDNLIRHGTWGKVYLGELPDGKTLAVMKLDNLNSEMALVDYLDLVLGISELRHPNIIELVGYCVEFEQRILVYNYSSSRSVYDALHSEDDLRRKLSWIGRLNIAIGAAKALEYLHEFCQPPVMHQNFESANILLDHELGVRVSECGLASLVSTNYVSLLFGGTSSLLSYLAPELSDSSHYTERSDVYSFGVVMLELLTGRKPYDSSKPRAEQYLVRWASSQLHDIKALSQMVDPSMEGNIPVKSLSRFADIISRCIQVVVSPWGDSDTGASMLTEFGDLICDFIL